MLFSSRPLVVSAVLLTLLAGSAIGAEASRPNILLIVADDLGWRDVGWHGGPFKTPNMDRLVHEGVELDQHYVQPLCTPTRTALMSGRYPSRFGPQALTPSNLRAMTPGTETIASALRSLGYETYQGGKWHLGSRMEWGPNHYGFQHSYGSLTGAVDPWTHKYRKGPYEDTWHRDEKRLDEEGNATELVAGQVVRWIEDKHGPWFIYMPFHAVHIPVDAPEEFKALYQDVKFDDDPAKNDSRRRLGAMTSEMDAKIGQFVAALERTGQRENTLIVFTSDNGGLNKGGNPYVGKVPPSPLNSDNRPLRGQKGELYEGGIRVDAFANWPGKLAPSKVTAPMHAVDWFPTLATVAGYRPGKDLKWDGRDNWPVLTGQNSSPEPRTIYWPFTKGNILRQGDWKLIVFTGGKTELYDLANDPYETHDLAAAQPERVAQLKDAMKQAAAADITELPADLVGIPK
jgi:arylsulfatase A-like enzyme